MDRKQLLIAIGIIVAMVVVVVVIIVIAVVASSDSSEGTSVYPSVGPSRPIVYPITPSSEYDDGGSSDTGSGSGMSDFGDEYAGSTSDFGDDYGGSTSDYGGSSDAGSTSDGTYDDIGGTSTGTSDGTIELYVSGSSFDRLSRTFSFELSNGNTITIDIRNTSCVRSIHQYSGLKKSSIATNGNGSLSFDITVRITIISTESGVDETVSETLRFYSDDISSGECTYEDYNGNTCTASVEYS